MSQNKNTLTTVDHLAQLAQQAGIMLMAGAATVGMLEPSAHDDRRIVVPNQPTFAFANEDEELNNPIRNEREDVSSQYVSYSETQRTASRSGKM